MSAPLNRRRVMVGAVASAATSSIISTAHASTEFKVHEVKIKSFKFAPQILQVKVGDTIRWTNQDVAPHTATANEGGWDTSELTKGNSFDVIVTVDMETSYFCAFHPHMKASFEIA